MINYEDFSKVEIQIGEIKKAEKIEKSEKLFLLSVDFGEEEERTVVSGIAPFFESPEDVVGTQCAFVTNLEPRPLMGHESQAMILGVKEGDSFALLTPSKKTSTGAKVG
jgi:methionyl-tRNA synthetase